MKKTLIMSVLVMSMSLAGANANASLWRPSLESAQSGMASYYHDGFHGQRTASGARYDKNRLTAAHRSLPLGTQVRVTDAGSGESVIVHINDRGPFGRGRVIDLSRAAAREIGLTRKGVARVRLEVLSKSNLFALNGPITLNQLF